MQQTESKVIELPAAVQVDYDAKLWIATGRSRYDKKWKNRQLAWSSLLGRLSHPATTPETFAEYMKMSKDEQDNTKDVGGFVGGTLEGGRRSAKTVKDRSILSFDLDFAPVDFYSDIKLDGAYASACYSTHKHQPEKPRLRLLIPLSRSVSPDEYEATARMLASDIGMDYMDPSTFQPSRLMYWPSHAEDAPYFFDYVDAPFLDPDDILKRYPGGSWHDASLWPTSKLEVEKHHKVADKQADPTTKPGIVGAFCRAYTISQAIETFLSDIYAPTDHEDRYTYIPGSTTAGLVIYDDDKFAFSNHGTDPAGGMECNAWDLVRIHLFGSEDDSVRSDTSPTKRPSYKKMEELAFSDEKASGVYYDEHQQVTAEDFEDDPEIKDVRKSIWRKLAKGRAGAVVKSVDNCSLIFAEDPSLHGIRRDLLADDIKIDASHPVPWDREPGPWCDLDDSQLYTYIAKTYQVEFARQYVLDQLGLKANSGRYHPIKQYLEALPAWDGQPRAETLLIDYLGAEDNVYTREASKKILLAAVRRIYEPGCKFDNMLVISGPPGTGKSTLIGRLAGQWFSDSLTFEDMKDKTAAEKLQGYWLLEIGEMKGMRKMDVESIKAFISRQEDIYRSAYGRHVGRHPRQCVIFGTVNNVDGYLKDISGNRRFWPVEVTGKSNRKPWDLIDEDRDQIWAEIFYLYKEKHERSLLLSPEAEKIAQEKQIDALESDEREGLVADYLEREVPEGWDTMSHEARIAWLDGSEDALMALPPQDGTEIRTQISVIEIWCECFCNPITRITRRDSYDIAAILIRLGWERSSRRPRISDYGRQRVFVKR
jgi:putative DNA primase/helicase